MRCINKLRVVASKGDSYAIEIFNACTCRKINDEARRLVLRYLMPDDAGHLYHFLGSPALEIVVLKATRTVNIRKRNSTVEALTSPVFVSLQLSRL